jgi:hypothetical protein
MPKYQLVLQWRTTDPSDFDHLIYFENTLETRLGRRLGKVDGHDIGSGEMNIFIFTDNPEKAFSECRSLIRSSRLVSGLSAAYRPIDGEEYVRLWPEGSTDSFVIK